MFYSLGTFLLPLGDFAAIEDIPEMYRHCKATEDKDLTPFDFIKDHLINIDGIFDKHDKGDEQKPHSPTQFHHTPAQIVFVIQQVRISFNKTLSNKTDFPIYRDGFYFSTFNPFVFHPPKA